MKPIFLAWAALAVTASSAAPAIAAETIAYGYDARGRLVRVDRTGTVNSGWNATFTFDKADNRISRSVIGNNAPTTAPDTLDMATCGWGTSHVIANDSDPDGQALKVVSVSGTSLGQTSVVNGTSVAFRAWHWPGTATLTYVIEDSLGAQAKGSLTVTIRDYGMCM